MGEASGAAEAKGDGGWGRRQGVLSGGGGGQDVCNVLVRRVEEVSGAWTGVWSVGASRAGRLCPALEFSPSRRAGEFSAVSFEIGR